MLHVWLSRVRFLSILFPFSLYIYINLFIFLELTPPLPHKCKCFIRASNRSQQSNTSCWVGISWKLITGWRSIISVPYFQFFFWKYVLANILIFLSVLSLHSSFCFASSIPFSFLTLSLYGLASCCWPLH